ncbi:protein serine/threonine phosphatase 2C [Choiromyces venosus 120613-1]|uniref:Protein serine/threonine phosphatase 2C n=1 Tax=Choiromyces venosus 120613-1 TaxID=1336337 RepID=A0A3N4JA52_9PEZI|nr:protein serine/threonine phosphatase 2C [Choiromyces venosus 120613-1]
MGRSLFIPRGIWALKDTYTFISRFCANATSRAPSGCLHSFRHGSIRDHSCYHSAARHCSKKLGPPSIFKTRGEPLLHSYPGRRGGKRMFHDYFTMHLRRAAVKSERSSKSSEPHDTVVRIPLRSAKQHFGVSRSRGNRPYNEDWYQAGVIDIPPFTLAPDSAPTDPSVFYFGLFDGHGGEDCSAFVKDYLHTYIEQSAKAFSENEEQKISMQTQLVSSWKDTVGGYFRRFKPDFEGRGEAGEMEAVLTYAFLKADMDFITRTKPWFLTGEHALQAGGAPKKPIPFKGGSTASIALISTPTATPFWDPKTTATLITAHIGDTRILLSSTSTGLALPLTTNHHPSSPTESRRLRRYATAFVSDSFGEERFGVLANTRSFGDVSQKRLGVSAEPEVYQRELKPSEYAFMVLMSDGVTGILTDQEIVDIVKECRTPDEAAKELVAFADEVTTEGDNATAVVVRLGGWDQRAEGGEGFMGTKDLRAWRRDEALVGSRGRRM